MRPHPLFTLIFVAAPTLLAGEAAPRHFQSLSEATKFLDRALMFRNRTAILNALDSSSYFSQHPAVFEMLVDERKRAGALGKLYADRKFPTDSDTFKLGGHASELGHVHIDFIREKSGWRLKDIWNCR